MGVADRREVRRRKVGPSEQGEDTGDSTARGRALSEEEAERADKTGEGQAISPPGLRCLKVGRGERADLSGLVN